MLVSSSKLNNICFKMLEVSKKSNMDFKLGACVLSGGKIMTSGCNHARRT